MTANYFKTINTNIKSKSTKVKLLILVIAFAFALSVVAPTAGGVQLGGNKVEAECGQMQPIWGTAFGGAALYASWNYRNSGRNVVISETWKQCRAETAQKAQDAYQAYFDNCMDSGNYPLWYCEQAGTAFAEDLWQWLTCDCVGKKLNVMTDCGPKPEPPTFV